MKSVLGDFFDLQRGTTYKSALLGQPGPVLLGLGSIARNGGFKGSNLKTYGGPCDARHLLTPGEIYVSLKDVTQSADLLGAVARLPAHISLGRLTQDTVKLVFKAADAPRTYLYWLLQTPQYREYCRAHSTGTTNLGLARDDFLSFEVPPLTPYRQWIVSLVQNIEDKLELNRRMNEKLEEMAQAIFRDWFVDFGPVRRAQAGLTDAQAIMGGMIQDPARAAFLAALFPSAFTQDGLPTGWTKEPLLDQAHWINGAAYKNMHFVSKGTGLPVIKIAELKTGISDQTKFTNTDLGSKYRINNGELLFSWSGNPDTSIDAFIWIGGAAWLNQHIFAVRDNGKMDKATLHTLLKWLMPQFAELARNKQTTGLGHVTKDDMKRLLIVKSSESVAAAFSTFVEPIFERIVSTLYENQTLCETRNYLLPFLIFGAGNVTSTQDMT